MPRQWRAREADRTHADDFALRQDPRAPMRQEFTTRTINGSGRRLPGTNWLANRGRVEPLSSGFDGRGLGREPMDDAAFAKGRANKLVMNAGRLLAFGFFSFAAIGGATEVTHDNQRAQEIVAAAHMDPATQLACIQAEDPAHQEYLKRQAALHPHQHLPKEPSAAQCAPLAEARPWEEAAGQAATETLILGGAGLMAWGVLESAGRRMTSGV